MWKTSPKRLQRGVEVLGLATSAFVGAGYWIAAAGRGEPLSVSTLYRIHDASYLPLIHAVARGQLSEFTLFEELGSGELTFPLLSVAPWSLVIAALGPVGFLLADMALAVARYVIVVALARKLIDNRAVAAAAGLVTMLAWGPIIGSGTWQAWSYRYPRPYWTSVIVLATLLALAECWERRRGSNPWPFLALGVCLAAVAQGDIHAATSFALGAILVAGASTLGRDRSVRLWLVAAGVAAVALTPFLFQATATSTETLVRLGQFPADRFPPSVFLRFDAMLAALPLLLVAFVSAVPRWRERVLSPSIRAVAVTTGAVVLASHLAMPAFAMATGRLVQPYHFRQRVFVFATIALGMAALLLLGGLVEYWSRKANKSAAGQNALVVVVLLAVAAGLVREHWLYVRTYAEQEIQPRVYAGEGWDSIDGYRRGLQELVDELGASKYANATILGTLDNPLALWWTANRGQTYAADAFLSSVSDETIERRLAELSRALGMSEEDFTRHLDEDYFLANFLGAAKYQASRAHTLRPIDQYTPAQRERIESSSFLNNWQLFVPASDLQRLRSRFRAADRLSDRIDLLILTKSPSYPELGIDQMRFEITFENSVFVVARPRSEPRSSGPAP